MGVSVREVTEAEALRAGSITAEAYLEFFAPEVREGWSCGTTPSGYLGEIADVAGRMQRSHVLVAVDDDSGEILGTITLEIESRIDPAEPAPAPDEMHIRMLGVATGQRGRGVGRRLMDAALDLGRRTSRTRVTLHTTGPMTAAQSLYESMGFVRGTDETLDNGTRLLGYELRLDGSPAPTG